MAASVEIFDQALKVRLAKMIAANRDARPLTAAWAADLHGGVEDVLEAEGLPRWQALSKITRARRAGKNKTGKMLQVTGKLAASIQPDSGAAFAQVTTNDVRARTLHAGAKQGQFGRSKRNGPLPWGNIPARPFMVIPPYVKATIVARGLKWVSGNGL